MKAVAIDQEDFHLFMLPTLDDRQPVPGFPNAWTAEYAGERRTFVEDPFTGKVLMVGSDDTAARIFEGIARGRRIVDVATLQAPIA